jgi:2-aminoethylphosphonate-pyruvate transaminase
MALDKPMTRNQDKLLYTPGPLTTSATVKAAMLRDLGSRDQEFMSVVRNIREKLLAIGGQANDSLYSVVPMQGSGTFGIEAAISSIVPRDGKLLVIINGAYGKRIVQMAHVYQIEAQILQTPENILPDLQAVESALNSDSGITTVAVVHCETTTGILNPIQQIGEIVNRLHRVYFVDAMSSFGAIPIDLVACHIDYLVSSSNKCIEGVPGFSFALARKEALQATEGYARTLALNLLAQWQELEKTGQFRYTPPTHVMLAFNQALHELEAEGGVAGRAARYRDNHDTLLTGMRELGFRVYLPPELQSYIITTFYYPEHPNFNFETFYQMLNDKGFVIYPGKLGDMLCFRLGNIGRLFPEDMTDLLKAIRETLEAMNVTL